MKIGLTRPWTVILNTKVKDLLFAFAEFETKNKQILRRGVYPEHGRRTPQNDIATKSPRPGNLRPQFSKKFLEVNVRF
jgi:hypothetical protein